MTFLVASVVKTEFPRTIYKINYLYMFQQKTFSAKVMINDKSRDVPLRQN